MRSTTRMVTWARNLGALMPPSHQARLQAAQAMGARLPALTLSGECWFADPVEPWMRRAVLDRMAEKEQQHVEHVSGSVIVDDDQSFIQRFVMAFWRLCDQQIAAVTRPGDHLPLSLRHRPPEPSDEVRVVTLRRVQTSPDTAHDAGDLRWHHRWVVQMHKRRQWYPSLGVHKIIFVGPYIKGPDGLPLKPAAQSVHALSR